MLVGTLTGRVFTDVSSGSSGVSRHGVECGVWDTVCFSSLELVDSDSDNIRGGGALGLARRHRREVGPFFRMTRPVAGLITYS